ncbi:hypothetical protein RFF05_07960 [Bengtsoniella intestinalis]|uniref:hypothetical protein n=1 Tax=Bengtsoniella intestinalis TaxID=3073143 RepID=UPI00391F788A
MKDGFDINIAISIERNEFVVEQMGRNGVIANKNISPDAFLSCVANSCIEDNIQKSGLLPKGCIATSIGRKNRYYFMRYTALEADFTYATTEYLHFPIPRLVFGFEYQPAVQKVTGYRVCVVPDGPLQSDSTLYHYPFSNVGVNGHICLGNNALPKYKRPEQLSTLPDYILRIPNNNDHYSTQHNKQGLQYRDLLEHLKDKSPAYYYEHVLVESGRTLGQFLEWS